MFSVLSIMLNNIFTIKKFLILIFLCYLIQNAFAKNNFNLTNPCLAPRSKASDEHFFVPDSGKGINLRQAMRHDMGNINGIFDWILNDNKIHSKKFKKIKRNLFRHIDNLYKILQNEKNPNWESDFKIAFKKFTDDIDLISQVLSKEIGESRNRLLKNAIGAMILFYKSFADNDPIVDIDLEKIFNIIRTQEINPDRFIFNFSGPQTSCHAVGKEGEIYRAFLNLVRNGVEAIKRKMYQTGHRKANYTGSIDVRVSSFDIEGYSIIEICDNGPGLPREALEAFLDPYKVYSSKGELGGRGLKAARNIIERNHGTIDVTSEPDRGTTFIIKLPSSNQTLKQNENETIITQAA